MATLTEMVVSALTGRMTDEEYARAVKEANGLSAALAVMISESVRARAREERLEKALREILDAAGASDAEIANYVWRTATKALEE